MEFIIISIANAAAPHCTPDSNLCSIQCDSGRCRGFNTEANPSGWGAEGCIDSSYCTNTPEWAEGIVCVCGGGDGTDADDTGNAKETAGCCAWAPFAECGDTTEWCTDETNCGGACGGKWFPNGVLISDGGLGSNDDAGGAACNGEDSSTHESCGSHLHGRRRIASIPPPPPPPPPPQEALEGNQEALELSLRFFDAQRSGAIPAEVKARVRANGGVWQEDSFLQDGKGCVA